jgi:hypothetical protein
VDHQPPAIHPDDVSIAPRRLRRRFLARVATASVALVLAGLLASGCGNTRHAAATPTAPPAKPRCAHPAEWQALADRMHMPVYCPGWLPDPLTSQIGGQWNSMNSVVPTTAYVESFIWQDTDTPGISGVLHVILHGYPNRTTIPTCLGGPKQTTRIPCFSEPTRTVVRGGIHARLYTVNRDFDAWHLALLWRHAGNLYVISQHLAPPLSYSGVVADLAHELADLVLVEPKTAA